MTDHGAQNNLPTGPDTPVSHEPGGSNSGGGSNQDTTVTGRVRDTAGKPVVGAAVVPQSKDVPPQPIPELAALTDDTGAYRWTLPPGKYIITAHHDRYPAATSAPVTIGLGQTVVADIVMPS
jgi:hypothetical protein